MNTCPTCGAPKPNEDWNWDTYDHRLVSAAPELLHALQQLLSMWEESIGWEPNYMHMADPARKAIAKAEGRGE